MEVVSELFKTYKSRQVLDLVAETRIVGEREILLPGEPVDHVLQQTDLCILLWYGSAPAQVSIAIPLHLSPSCRPSQEQPAEEPEQASMMHWQSMMEPKGQTRCRH